MDTFGKLRKKQTLRRIIEGTVAFLSFAALILFSVLKENSKTVTVTEVTPFYSYKSVTYTHDYAVAIMIAAVIFALSVSFFLADLLFSRIRRAEIDGEEIIVYNGLGLIKLIVNGEEKDSMFFKSYLEAKLKSGVTAVISRQFFTSYHVTFSDGRPPLDM